MKKSIVITIVALLFPIWLIAESPESASTKPDRYQIIEWLSSEFGLSGFFQYNDLPESMHGPILATSARLPDERSEAEKRGFTPEQPPRYVKYDDKKIGFLKEKGMDWRREADIPYLFMARATDAKDRQGTVILLPPQSGKTPDVIFFYEQKFGPHKPMTIIEYHVKDRPVREFTVRLID